MLVTSKIALHQFWLVSQNGMILSPPEPGLRNFASEL
jgi:hypothetical protein